MKRRFEQPRQRRARLLATAATTTAMIMTSAGIALAQDADEDEEDVIVVTGIRGSIESSINAKKQNSSIVEAISAEDIGKLPDVSIADSLSRLPGLTAQRLHGRAQVISVRGLAPDFTTALLNGREQVNSGDNRGVEFDQYPSEILSQVVLYKTPDAALIGQGLGGTADMRTIRPLSYGEEAMAFSARYDWNDFGALNAETDARGYRLTGSWVGQSEDEKWGWVLAGSFINTPTQANRFDAWGYPSTGGGELIIGGSKPYVQSSTLDRKSVLGTIEYEPNGTFHSVIDVMYSNFQEDQTLRGIELPLQWSGASLQPGYTIEDGLVTSGTFNGVQGVVRNDIRTRDVDLFSVGWTNTWRGENWEYAMDLSRSSVERHDTDLETYAGTGPGFGNGASDNLGFSVNSGGGFVFNSTLDYADPNLIMLTDPQGWGQAGFIKEPKTDDVLTALRLTAGRDFAGEVSSVEVGVNVSRRSKDKISEEAFVDLIGGNGQAVPIPSQFLLQPTALDFLGIPGMVSYNPLDLLNNGGVYQLRPLLHQDVLAKAWGVDEDVAVAYAKFGLDSALGDVPVTGNFGLQVVYTDQSSTGQASSGSGANLVTVDRSGGAKYTELLPSVNLNFEMNNDTYVRFGAARTMARPRMDQMRGSFNFGWNFNNESSTDPTNSYWNGNGGNPELRPWMAQAFDLSVEKYFGGRAGYISAAAFYKHLENFIYNQNELFDFTGYPLRLPTDNPAIFQGTISTPQNGSGGYIRGIELALSLPADIISPALDGFGFSTNGSFTESNIETNGPGSSRPLEGLSEVVVNTSVYYEKNGYQARVSNRYRSDFLGEVTGFGANRDFRNIEGSSVYDGQIGYSFESGPMAGASLLFQVYNITDEEFKTFLNDDPRQVKDLQNYGRTYLLSFNYRR